ncbi:hypothetical protein SLA2020_281960 [Shorea laevis]
MNGKSPSSFPSPDAGRSVRCRQLEIRGGRSGVEGEGLSEFGGGAKWRRVKVGGREEKKRKKTRLMRQQRPWRTSQKRKSDEESNGPEVAVKLLLRLLALCCHTQPLPSLSTPSCAACRPRPRSGASDPSTHCLSVHGSRCTL